MDKSEGKDWFAKTLNNITEETAKVYNISKLKLEINTLNKTYKEKQIKIYKKLMELINEGKIDANFFQPDYEHIIELEKRIEGVEEEIDGIKNNFKLFGKKEKSSSDKNTASDDKVYSGDIIEEKDLNDKDNK